MRVADFAVVDPSLQVRGAQTHDPLKRHAGHPCGLDGLHHAIGLRKVHRHWFAEHEMLPGLRASHRQRFELGHGSGELDDVDPFALEQLTVIGVPLDAERAGEGVELRAVVPRGGDELRFAVFQKRPGETVGGIPVGQSQDRHSPPTHRARPSS